MTFKKTLTVSIFLTVAFLSGLSAIHAWTTFLAGGAGSFATIPPFLSSGFQIETTTYLIITLIVTCVFLGITCHVILNNPPSDLPLYQLSKDIEAKLVEESQEIKNSTSETLTKLGLREFQLKEGMKFLQKEMRELHKELEKGMENSKKVLDASQKKLIVIEKQTEKALFAQKDIPKLNKKLGSLETVEKDLKTLQEEIEKANSTPISYISSMDKIDALEGKILKKATIRKLNTGGFKKIEDLLLANSLEIAHTKAMSENEAKNLQSILQLLMVPGVKHEDAVLLLESGVNSKEELALQNTFSLGAKVMRITEPYILEGKIKEEEKPSLEEIASWIKWAKIQ